MGATRTKTKLLPLYLPGEVYARLERVALAEERDPLQHARWLIKQAIERTDRDSQRTGLPVEAGAA